MCPGWYRKLPKCAQQASPRAQLEQLRVVCSAVERAPFLECQSVKPDNRAADAAFRTRADNPRQSSTHVMRAAVQGHAGRV